MPEKGDVYTKSYTHLIIHLSKSVAPDGHLHTLTDPNGCAAAAAYYIREDFIRLCLLGIILDSVVQMLQLLVPDAPQGDEQLLHLLAHSLAPRFQASCPFQQHSHLVVIVIPNLRLHGFRACHGSFPAHDRSRPAECSSGNFPHRVHEGWAYPVFGKELIEDFEVSRFLIVHVLHQTAELRMRLDYLWRLGRVYEGGSEFPGLVYSQLVQVRDDEA
jgi:hypothetical protein